MSESPDSRQVKIEKSVDRIVSAPSQNPEVVSKISQEVSNLNSIDNVVNSPK
jgi:hypothetical protein